MSFSTLGRKKVAAHVVLLLLNAIVLILSTRVNQYQDFFFIADRFPFILSIITFVVLGLMTFVDFVSNSSYTGRPQFEIGVFAVFTILWLAFNSFSSSRWHNIPLNCGVIPADYPDTIQWCQELGALRGLVWIEWLMFFFTTIFTLQYCITQSNRGNKHIFEMPLSRYDPAMRTEQNGNVNYGDSTFSSWEKMN